MRGSVPASGYTGSAGHAEGPCRRNTSSRTIRVPHMRSDGPADEPGAPRPLSSRSYRMPPTAVATSHRMRLQTMDDYVWKERIDPGRVLQRSINADPLSTLILYDSPDTGKTTLTSIIANISSSACVTLNAVLARVNVLREAIEAAGRNLHIDSSEPLRLWIRSIDGTKPNRMPYCPMWETTLTSSSASLPRTLASRSSSPSSAALGWFRSDSSGSMRVAKTRANSGMFRSQVARHHPSGSPWIGQAVH